jgi:hypothetical protein
MKWMSCSAKATMRLSPSRAAVEEVVVHEHHRAGLAGQLDLGFGRMAVSGAEAPNMLVNLV